MAEQSHRDEMNAAIRAQRRRHAVPRSIAPADKHPPEPQPPQSPPPERKRLLARLFGR